MSGIWGDGGAGFGIVEVYGPERVLFIPQSNGVPTNASLYTTVAYIRGTVFDGNETSTGINQETAYQIYANDTLFTDVPVGTGAVLPNFPVVAVGRWGSVINAGANILLLYPYGTGTINGMGAGDALVIPPGSEGIVFINAPGEFFVR